MRALPRSLAAATLGLLVLGLLIPAGCNRNGGGVFGGSSSPTGDTGDQKKQQPQQKPGQSGMKETEPAGSVSGQPSATSDNGSPSAVGHRSVAEPGAPQGAAPDKSQKPAPKSPPQPPSRP